LDPIKKNGVNAFNIDFDWLANYEITERGYNSIKYEESTFVFKTNGADVSIILRQYFSKPQETKIMYAFFVPSKTQKLTKTINLVLKGIFSTE